MVGRWGRSLSRASGNDFTRVLCGTDGDLFVLYSTLNVDFILAEHIHPEHGKSARVLWLNSLIWLVEMTAALEHRCGQSNDLACSLLLIHISVSIIPASEMMACLYNKTAGFVSPLKGLP